MFWDFDTRKNYVDERVVVGKPISKKKLRQIVSMMEFEISKRNNEIDRLKGLAEQSNKQCITLVEILGLSHNINKLDVSRMVDYQQLFSYATILNMRIMPTIEQTKIFLEMVI